MDARPAFRWWQWLLTLALAALTCAALVVVAALAVFGGSTCHENDVHAMHVAQGVIIGQFAVVAVLWGTASALTRGRVAVLLGLALCSAVAVFCIVQALFVVDWNNGFCF